MAPVERREDLTGFAWLSIATGVLVFTLKLVAAAVTGSVGLLSDALETTVNVVAAIVALVVLKAAARPGNARMHFGLGKAEYFSAFFEGMMILLAAWLIMTSAVERFLHPRPLEDLEVGVAVSLAASVLNGSVAAILLRAGRQHRSIVLTADGKHLLTDVWSSVGVVLGVILVGLTGWLRLDPLIATVVAINIVLAGVRLIGRSAMGLLDAALPAEDNDAIVAILRRHQGDQLRFHAVQTRGSGRQRFVSMHVLVPGDWSVARGHDVLEMIEQEIRDALPGTAVSTHLEPIEDPRAWSDQPPGCVTIPEQETPGGA